MKLSGTFKKVYNFLYMIIHRVHKQNIFDFEKFPVIILFILFERESVYIRGVPNVCLSKHRCQKRSDEILQCRESIRDIIIYLHMKFRWNGTMLNMCSIVAAILKMASARNCSMSEINPGHHNLPTYEIYMISDNVEFLQYCGSHFENGDR
jgi:hypothetical protein